MEKWQRDHIRKNLPHLITNTICNSIFLASLYAEGVVSNNELEILQITRNQYDQANRLYDILQTRRDSFNVLKQALKDTLQTGALAILEQCHQPNIPLQYKTYGKISYSPELLLGRGSYNTQVHKGKFEYRDVAIKRINLDDDVELTKLRKEVEYYRKLDYHKNVVRHYITEITDGAAYIALELCDVNLHDWVTQKNKTVEIDVTEIIKQVTEGVAHIHANLVIHGDLKPANILLLSPSVGNAQVKISDFGSSQEIPDVESRLMNPTVGTGTEGWMAPEVTCGLFSDAKVPSLGFASDVFSLGCIYYFVLTEGLHPFGGQIECAANIVDGKHQLSEQQIVTSAANASEFIKIIRKMVAHDYDKRPSIFDVLAWLPAGIIRQEYFNDLTAQQTKTEEKTGKHAGDITADEFSDVEYRTPRMSTLCTSSENQSNFHPLKQGLLGMVTASSRAIPNQTIQNNFYIPYKNCGRVSYAPAILLGQGCYGTKVFKGNFEDKDVAVKRLNRQDVELTDVLEEVNFLADQLGLHNNVVRFFKAEVTDNFILIALELCDVNLFDWVTQKKKTVEIGVMEIINQTTEGIAYLHSNRVIHRNLKPSNILLISQSGNGKTHHQVKISDYWLSKIELVGVSRLNGPTIGVGSGTEEWMAPEVVGGLNFQKNIALGTGLANDIFSLGCIYYFVLSGGLHPFGVPPYCQVNILKRKSKVEGIDSGFIKLVSKMIAHEHKRPSIIKVRTWLVDLGKNESNELSVKRQDQARGNQLEHIDHQQTVERMEVSVLQPKGINVGGGKECSTSKLVCIMKTCKTFHTLHDEWSNIAYGLETSGLKVRRLRDDFRMGQINLVDVFVELLDEWIARKGSQATLQVFIDILTENKLTDVIETIEKDLAKPSNPQHKQ